MRRVRTPAIAESAEDSVPAAAAAAAVAGAVSCRFVPSGASCAPYPALSTASQTARGSAPPLQSTSIEFVSRLTETSATPGTFRTAFSTCALQAAQLMPVTLNFRSFLSCPVKTYLFRNSCPGYFSLRISSTVSSMIPSLPFRISSVTQASR